MENPMTPSGSRLDISAPLEETLPDTTVVHTLETVREKARYA